MKEKIVRRILSLVTVLVMVVSLAPTVPARVADAATSDLTKGIYDALMAEGSEFSTEKTSAKDIATYDATIEDNRITVSLTPSEAYKEYMDAISCFYDVGEDGYIRATSSADDYTEFFLLNYIADAVARYNKQDSKLLQMYLRTVSSKPVDTKYYKKSGPDEHGLYDVSIYAGAYVESEINEVLDKEYFDEETIKNSSIDAPLNIDSQSSVANAGKYGAVIDGNNYSMKMYFYEYGTAIDENGYASIKNLVSALKPVGYEDFIAKYDNTASFTGTVEKTRTQYSVSEPTAEEKQERFGDDPSFDISGRAFLLIEFTSPYIYTGAETSLPAGGFTFYSVDNSEETVKWTSSDKKVATIDEFGMIVALKKGTVTITATLESGYKLSTKFKVTSSPSIKVAGKKYNKSKTYTIKKGKTLSIKISGKSGQVDNKYSSTKKKVAKVTSSKTAETVKIKGLKKGKSTVKITVNGVVFKVKVKVK